MSRPYTNAQICLLSLKSGRGGRGGRNELRPYEKNVLCRDTQRGVRCFQSLQHESGRPRRSPRLVYSPNRTASDPSAKRTRVFVRASYSPT